VHILKTCDSRKGFILTLPPKSKTLKQPDSFSEKKESLLLKTVYYYSRIGWKEMTCLKNKIAYEKILHIRNNRDIFFPVSFFRPCANSVSDDCCGDCINASVAITE
jgi:hypothetical protein